MPLGYVELCARSKKKKTYFWGIHSFLRRMLGLKRVYCTGSVFNMYIIFNPKKEFLKKMPGQIYQFLDTSLRKKDDSIIK